MTIAVFLEHRAQREFSAVNILANCQVLGAASPKTSGLSGLHVFAETGDAALGYGASENIIVIMMSTNSYGQV